MFYSQKRFVAFSTRKQDIGIKTYYNEDDYNKGLIFHKSASTKRICDEEEYGTDSCIISLCIMYNISIQCYCKVGDDIVIADFGEFSTNLGDPNLTVTLINWKIILICYVIINEIYIQKSWLRNQ